MALENLKNKISDLRKKIHWLIAIQGFLKIALLFLMLCMTTFVLDYFLDLPLPMRIVFLVSIVVLHGYYAVKYLFIPWMLPMQDDDLVLAIEKANPFLKDRLISALQFSRLIEDPQYKDSKEMTRQVIEEAQSLLPQTRFTGILDIKHTLLFSLYPLGLAIFLFFRMERRAGSFCVDEHLV